MMIHFHNTILCYNISFEICGKYNMIIIIENKIIYENDTLNKHFNYY